MEVNRKNVVDVSSCFFFEATGDSDQADATFNDPNVAGVDHQPDDDAESSCSCDLSDDFPLFVTGHHHHHRDVNGCDDSVNGCDSRPCSSVDDGKEEEGDEAHSYSRWSCNKSNKKKKKKEKKKNKGVEREKKSGESVVDSSEEVLSEQEKNRLFWETCLAS